MKKVLNIVFPVAVLYYIVKTYPTARASSILFMPYILWLLFATYLNAYILLNN